MTEVSDLYLVTAPHPNWWMQVTSLVRQGVHWVQIRDKHATDDAIFEQGEALLRFCQQQGLPCEVLINDRVPVAKALGVGVHLGQGDMSPHEARSILGSDAVIGWTVHDNIKLAEEAARWIDYVGVGPIFPTTTKLDTRDVIGVQRLCEVVASLTVPVVAIGGIHAGNIQSVRGGNPWKIAMSSALMSATTLNVFTD